MTIVKPSAISTNTRNYILGGIMVLSAIGILVVAETVFEKKSTTKK